MKQRPTAIASEISAGLSISSKFKIFETMYEICSLDAEPLPATESFTFLGANS